MARAVGLQRPGPGPPHLRSGGPHGGTFARRARHPNECSGHLSQCFTPSSSLRTLSTSTCMTVGDQITSHFFTQQMGRSHAPCPCRPHHGHPPQNQRIPFLCVTDHSSGHTEEWESLTPTRRATPKREKTLPGAPGVCPARYRTLHNAGEALFCPRANMWCIGARWGGGPGGRRCGGWDTIRCPPPRPHHSSPAEQHKGPARPHFDAAHGGWPPRHTPKRCSPAAPHAAAPHARRMRVNRFRYRGHLGGGGGHQNNGAQE